MQLLNHTSIITREESYTIQHPTEGVIHCKEYHDQSGKVIDSILRSKHGYEIDDPNLADEIWSFIDQLETNQ